jgi:hypothetical protein
MPPYYSQKHTNTCSLAVLRSVLALNNIQVTEEELIDKIKEDYGTKFKNIWNPTIAKLAAQYGVSTKMYALWPLFKKGLAKTAAAEYSADPNQFSKNTYENPTDKEKLPEPLTLAYKEMFTAIELGCDVYYGKMTAKRISDLLSKGYVIQTSIRTEKLYKDAKPSFHSLLIFSINGRELTYHDPARSADMKCAIDILLNASNNTGAFMAYKVV